MARPSLFYSFTHLLNKSLDHSHSFFALCIKRAKDFFLSLIHTNLKEIKLDNMKATKNKLCSNLFSIA
jgi:hypothetical protein